MFFIKINFMLVLDLNLKDGTIKVFKRYEQIYLKTWSEEGPEIIMEKDW